MYGLNEWSKATFHWPSRPQKSKAHVSGQHLTIFVVLLMTAVFLVKGIPRHGSTAAIGSTAGV
jgi:hypothetical protein